MSEIPNEHLKVSPHPNRAPGGQHVGTSSGIEVEHLPSGIIARVDIGRSQHHNKIIAMDMILAAITHPHYRGVV